MCGISGIISSSSLLEKKIKIMINTLRHRGPDFKSVYIHNNLALGNNRLSIVDLSEKSNQPMLDENKKYAITFNGEIYNFRSLKKKLLNDGISFFSNGDTEVLLKGYSLYGNKIFDLVVGFYAVCIYNIDKKKIILARDYFGKKPLYYSNTNNEFVFASEIKAIKSAINKIPDINNDSLSHYLWKGYYANGNTAYKNMYDLLRDGTRVIDLNPVVPQGERLVFPCLKRPRITNCRLQDLAPRENLFFFVCEFEYVQLAPIEYVNMVAGSRSIFCEYVQLFFLCN